MPPQKSEDYKTLTVKYHIKNGESYSKTCNIFKCSERSLKRWIDRYKKNGNVRRRNRSAVSYKITKTQVDDAIKILKKNEQITLEKLRNKIKKLDISARHLGNVLRDNNITRKRIRNEHFPKERYGKRVCKKEELLDFYKNIKKFKLNKIISIDETSIKPLMVKEYSRCRKGYRCIVKTDDNKIFSKYTLLVAIGNSKCLGYKLYKKGGMTKERFVDFMKEFIFPKYKNNLIVLDNAGSHKNSYVKNAITKSSNKYLFTIPNPPKTNPIENYFSQIKSYLKIGKKVLDFDELNKEISKTIKSIRSSDYKKYFLYAYDKNKLVLPKKRNVMKITKRYKK